MTSNAAWKIATGVLVVALIAVGAFALGRGSGPNAQPPEGPPTATPGDGENPTGDPSTPEGRAVPVGEVEAGAGGTKRGPGGIPIGYPHTADGAVAAATNYQMAAADSSVLGDTKLRNQLIETIIADPTQAKALKEDWEAMGDVEMLKQRLEPERGAYAVMSQSDDAVTVLMWAPAPNDQEHRDPWLITEVDLVWKKGDWKVVPGSGDLVASRASTGESLQPADPNAPVSPEEKFQILKQSKPADASAEYDDEELLERAQEATWWEYTNAE